MREGRTGPIEEVYPVAIEIRCDAPKYQTSIILIQRGSCLSPSSRRRPRPFSCWPSSLCGTDPCPKQRGLTRASHAWEAPETRPGCPACRVGRLIRGNNRSVNFKGDTLVAKSSLVGIHYDSGARNERVDKLRFTFQAFLTGSRNATTAWINPRRLDHYRASRNYKPCARGKPSCRRDRHRSRLAWTFDRSSCRLSFHRTRT
jgi:hypothetical protein